MDKYIKSKYTRERYEAIDFELTDFNKATIIWNDKMRTLNERLEALAEISDSTSDMKLKEQIQERIDFEQKAMEAFVSTNDENVVYVLFVESDMYGIFAKFDTAVVQIIRLNLLGYIADNEGIRIEKQIVVMGDTVPTYKAIGLGDNDLDTYCGNPIAYAIMNGDGEFIDIVFNRDEDIIIDPKFIKGRFENSFIALPYVHYRGLPVKNVVTGEYGIVETDKDEWEKLLETAQNCQYVTYDDDRLTVYCLSESGEWFHKHWNPMNIELEMPKADWSDEKQRTFEIAMSAFSEYIFGNHSEAHKKIVVRTSREYALACSCSKIIYEDSEIEEILW